VRSRTKTLAQRFWPKVKIGSPQDCWEWQGAKYSNGYGCIGEGGKFGAHLCAHRVAYELTKGAIPEGLVIDHLCRNIICVNPAHLEAVTQKENNRRGVGASGTNARKQGCINGHLFSGTNVRGDRICHTCDAARARKYKRAKRP